MDGIEKITDRIAADTDAEADRILQQAKAEAAEITASFEAEASEAAEKILAAGKVAAAEQAARIQSGATLRAKQEQLAVKQEVLQQAFSQALDRLCSLPEEEYVSLLAKLAVEASVTGEESLIFSPTDRSRYGKKVVMQANELLAAAGKPANLTLDEESRPMRGGICIRAGKIEDNCSLETIVHLMQESVAGEMAEILFA